MASSPLQYDLKACSICFEKFRSPRCLPCSHLFCQGCLSSYIVTSCESKEAPIGFSCPLCREFIPSPDPSDKAEKWAENFPLCEMFEKWNDLIESRLCSACQRESEEEEATNICLTCQDTLCGICTKSHRRNRASNTHKIIPIDDPNAVRQLTSASIKIENCQEHTDRKLELYCNDHSEACCTLCVSTEHRKCDSIDDIQKAVEKIKKSDDIQAWQEELRKYETELQEAKKNNEDNISEIDNTSDLIMEETKKLKKGIIEQLDKFESEHQDELSKAMKESRGILNKNIGSLSDRIQFTRHCLKSLREVNVEEGASFMKEYHKIKENIETLKKQIKRSINELKIKVESNSAKELEKIRNAVLSSKPQVKIYRRNPFSDIDLLNAHFSLLYDFDIQNPKIYGGTFLHDGTFVVASYSSSNTGLAKYSLSNDNSTLLKTFQSNSYLFDVQCVENELFVTDYAQKCINVISSDTFTSIRKISVGSNSKLFGISVWKGVLYVACITAILKYDMQGNFIHSYPVEKIVLNVAVTDNGHIVFSNINTNDVTAIDNQGNQLWKYSSPKLKEPRGIDKDKMNNIYIAGHNSDNVHIMSSNGTLIRIVENIPKPAFMKVKEGSNICCVCSHFKNFRVYEIYCTHTD